MFRKLKRAEVHIQALGRLLQRRQQRQPPQPPLLLQVGSLQQLESLEAQSLLYTVGWRVRVAQEVPTYQKWTVWWVQPG